jgi:uncharacterized FlaG/YvyC family protein
MEISSSLALTPALKISALSPVSRPDRELARSADDARPGAGTTPISEMPALLAGASTERDVTIDPATREVVLRMIDSRSGEVVRQVPDQALLRIRAYANELRRVAAESLLERSA